MNANWIINKEGKIYHLNLKRENLSTIIITVGDPERVPMISRHFDRLEFKNSSREFVTHTGYFQNKRISVISTGIGTDNIDIVMNEIDALFNIDFETNQPKKQITILNFIRIGTSGAIQPEINIDSTIISQSAIGLDVLLNFYDKQLDITEKEIVRTFKEYNIPFDHLNYTKADSLLLEHFKSSEILLGNTITAPGFYAPQGRQVRIKSKYPDLLEKISSMHINQIGRITNIEMETSGLYGLANLMGHKSISLNAILANRATNQFSNNPQQTMEKLIEYCLDKIVCLK